MSTERDRCRHREASRPLERHGIRPTPRRIEIAGARLQRHQRRSGDPVPAATNPAGVRVSKATVYNALRLLASKGAVRGLVVDEGRVFFQSNRDRRRHILTDETGDLVDIVPDHSLDQLQPLLPEGTELVSVGVVVRVPPPPDNAG